MTASLVQQIHVDLRIRPADPDNDLDVLVQELGQQDFFNDRISRQKTGHGVLLIAWLRDRPIGDAYLWMEAAEEAEIRTQLPGVPLLTHVEIHERYRSQGIGTKLIIKAEDFLMHEHGYDRVALAVEINNQRATDLYTRLGYHDWENGLVSCHPYDDGGGSRLPVDVCRVLVKKLSR